MNSQTESGCWQDSHTMRNLKLWAKPLWLLHYNFLRSRAFIYFIRSRFCNVRLHNNVKFFYWLCSCSLSIRLKNRKNMNYVYWSDTECRCRVCSLWRVLQPFRFLWLPKVTEKAWRTKNYSTKFFKVSSEIFFPGPGWCSSIHDTRLIMGFFVYLIN